VQPSDAAGGVNEDRRIGQEADAAARAGIQVVLTLKVSSATVLMRLDPG
jgi:hypothetical protein